MTSFDPPGTEYATAGAEVRGLEGWLSLAKFLGTTVGHVLDMRDSNQLAAAIKTENRKRKLTEEQRAAGYVKCRTCGGAIMRGQMCQCGDTSPGGTLDGAEAMSRLRQRFLDPTLQA